MDIRKHRFTANFKTYTRIIVDKKRKEMSRPKLNRRFRDEY